MKRQSFFINRERDVRLHGVCWLPEETVETQAIVMIAHGMVEHILRYDDFARYLTSQGYIVYGHDHRGHGQSITAPDDWGFFADAHGFDKVVEDMYIIHSIIHQKHPNLPIFLFGHSMGSFLSRRFIQLYGKQIAGVILSGTGSSKGLIGKAGHMIAKLETHRIGRRTPSKLMDQLIFGNFNKSFSPTRTAFDFLTRDEKVVDDYIADNSCGFVCSAQFYADLLYGIELIHKKSEVARVPKDLPIFLMAGDQDPVGDHGNGVKKVYEQYKEAGMQDVSMILYPGARHEILNEINQMEVYQDVCDWLQMEGIL